MKEQIEKLKMDFFILKTLVGLKKEYNTDNFLIDNMLTTYASDMYLIMKELVNANIEFKFLSPVEVTDLNDVTSIIKEKSINELVINLNNSLDTNIIDRYVKLIYKREGKMFISGALEKTYDDEVAKVLKNAYKYIKKS